MNEDSEMISSPYAFYAFYCLYKYFATREVSHHSLREISRRLYPSMDVNLEEKVSLFITWKKKGKMSKEYQLRGCIGTFSKLPVAKGIERYSLIAALEDSRFPPISNKELKHLKCSCNILRNFKTIYKEGIKNKDIFNWELGTHGIELRFKDPKTSKACSATFLPDVMTEQGWDKTDTFRNLIEKSGCWSDVQEIMDHYDDYFIEVIRYEGNKSNISYEDFKKELEVLQN